MHDANVTRTRKRKQQTISNKGIFPGRYTLLGLLYIGPSQTRYTNNGYPKGMPMSVAPEYLGKSKTCVETPSIIISKVEELQGEAIDPENTPGPYHKSCVAQMTLKILEIIFCRVRGSAPDGSSPRVYGQVLAFGHRLKLYYSMKNLTISWCNPSFYRLLLEDLMKSTCSRWEQAPLESQTRVESTNLVYCRCRKSCVLQMLSTIFEVIFLSGARPALPMGVAPEATAKCLHLGVGSTCF